MKTSSDRAPAKSESGVSPRCSSPEIRAVLKRLRVGQRPGTAPRLPDSPNSETQAGSPRAVRVCSLKALAVLQEQLGHGRMAVASCQVQGGGTSAGGKGGGAIQISRPRKGGNGNSCLDMCRQEQEKLQPQIKLIGSCRMRLTQEAPCYLKLL